ELARDAFQTVAESGTDARDAARRVMQLQSITSSQVAETASANMSAAIERVTGESARTAERIGETADYAAEAAMDAAPVAVAAAAGDAWHAIETESPRTDYVESDFEFIFRRREPENWRDVIEAAEQAAEKEELPPPVAQRITQDISTVRRKRSRF